MIEDSAVLSCKHEMYTYKICYHITNTRAYRRLFHEEEGTCMDHLNYATQAVVRADDILALP